MSPLARPLLALAAAALLACAHAEDDLLRGRLMGSSAFQGKRGACSELTMGPTPDKDAFITKNELDRFHANPERNPIKFNIKMPNSAKKGEILVGQRVLVCDFHNPDNSVDVKEKRHYQYTDLTVTCKKGCPQGVEVITDQFVIKKLI